MSSFCSKALRVLYFSNVTCHTLWFMNNEWAQNMKHCVCKSGWHRFMDSFQIVFIIGGVVVVVVVTFNIMQNLVNPLIFLVLKKIAKMTSKLDYMYIYNIFINYNKFIKRTILYSAFLQIYVTFRCSIWLSSQISIHEPMQKQIFNILKCRK